VDLRERAIIKYLLAACHALLRSGQVPIRVERRKKMESNLYLAARAAPFLGIHNKATPPGLKNVGRPKATPTRRPALTACVRLQTHFDLLPPQLHTNAPTHPRQKRFPRARICKFSHGQFFLERARSAHC